MKKIVYLLLFVLSFKANSQPYSLTVTSSSYSPLTGATNVSSGIFWSYATSFTVPIGFSFNFMGNNYSTIYVEGGGFTYFDPSYYYILLPFGVALKDKGTSSPLSPINYKTEGIAPNRICKIEWNNADYYNNPGSTANFQLWLYETTNVIESRAGSCTVSNPSLAYSWNSANGPSIGLYEYTATSLVYGFGLTGAMATPTENNNLSGSSAINPFDYSLSQTPFSGTVYRFTPDPLAINEAVSLDFSLHYDAYTGKIIFNSSAKKIETISLYNLNGKLVHSVAPVSFSGDFSIPFSLKKGIYIAKTKFPDNDVVSQKLILF